MNGLKYLLIMNEMSDSELATILGIKEQRIKKWLTYFAPIPLHHKDNLVNLFNIPFSYFQKKLNNEDILYIFNHNEGHPSMRILKYMRIINNMKNQDLADKLGVRKECISMWTGLNSPIPQNYEDKFYNIFGVSLDFLCKKLTREDILFILNIDMNKIVLRETEELKEIIDVKVEVEASFVSEAKIKVQYIVKNSDGFVRKLNRENKIEILEKEIERLKELENTI